MSGASRRAPLKVRPGQDDLKAMSRTCGGCLPPGTACTTGRLLLATRSRSTAATLRSVARRRAQDLDELAEGAFELVGPDLDELLFSAHALLSAAETEEVRCLLTGCDVVDRELLARALTAPTLSALVRERLGVDPQALDVPDLATGLPDRWSMLEQLEAGIDRSGVLGRSLAVLLLSLDDDGHDDRVLAEVADRLRAALRGSDLLARSEAAEFGAVLGDLDALDAERVAFRVADDLLAALQRPVTVDGRVAPVTARVGIAVFPRHGWTGTELLGAADVALHAAWAGAQRAVLSPG